MKTFRVTVLQYEPDFVMDSVTKKIASRSDQPGNPALLLAVAGPCYSNHRWVFARFPNFDMHTEQSGGPSPLQFRYVYHPGDEPAAPKPAIKSFKSTIEVIENGAVTQTRNIEVNRPFTHKGYTFYQTGYNPEDLTWTSLQVVRDPGVPLVYAGFALMIAGLFMVFYLNPWMETRKHS